MSRSDGTTTVDHVWDVAASLPLLLQDGTNTYVYGLGLISIYDGSDMTYRLVDGLGSTVNLGDQNGDLAGEYTYDAYGNEREQTGDETEFSFAGEQNDPNGLDFLRARYYNPEIGRFLGRDSAGQGSNFYGYALGNPVNRVDPSGLWSICLQWDSKKSNAQTGDCVCALSQEVDLVFTMQVVYDSETEKWVPPFAVEVWDPGDVACGTNACASQLDVREYWVRHYNGPNGRVRADYTVEKRLDITWLIMGLGDQSVSICDDAWQEGLFTINSSGCDDISWVLDGDDRFDNVIVACGIAIPVGLKAGGPWGAFGGVLR